MHLSDLSMDARYPFPEVRRRECVESRFATTFRQLSSGVIEYDCIHLICKCPECNTADITFRGFPPSGKWPGSGREVNFLHNPAFPLPQSDIGIPENDIAHPGSDIADVLPRTCGKGNLNLGADSGNLNPLCIP